MLPEVRTLVPLTPQLYQGRTQYVRMLIVAIFDNVMNLSLYSHAKSIIKTGERLTHCYL